MFKRVVRKLREKRGDGELIGNVFVLVTALIVTVLIIASATLGPKAAATYTAAHEIADKIATDGKYDAEEQAYIQDYLSQAKLSATIFCDRSGTIQMGDTFTVTLTSNATIGVGNIGTVHIPIPAKASERSKVYTAGG